MSTSLTAIAISALVAVVIAHPVPSTSDDQDFGTPRNFPHPMANPMYNPMMMAHPMGNPFFNPMVNPMMNPMMSPMAHPFFPVQPYAPFPFFPDYFQSFIDSIRNGQPGPMGFPPGHQGVAIVTERDHQGNIKTKTIEYGPRPTSNQDVAAKSAPIADNVPSDSAPVPTPVVTSPEPVSSTTGGPVDSTTISTLPPIPANETNAVV